MQKAHKSVQADQYLRSQHLSIVPSSEIRVHSRLILARYKGCTKGRCILSRSYGHEEFTNGNPFLVQKALKVHRPTNISVHRSTEASMAIRVHSRQIQAGYKGCTKARCILSRSYGHEEFKIENPFSVQ